MFWKPGPSFWVPLDRSSRHHPAPSWLRHCLVARLSGIIWHPAVLQDLFDFLHSQMTISVLFRVYSSGQLDCICVVGLDNHPSFQKRTSQGHLDTILIATYRELHITAKFWLVLLVYIERHGLPVNKDEVEERKEDMHSADKTWKLDETWDIARTAPACTLPEVKFSDEVYGNPNPLLISQPAFSCATSYPSSLAFRKASKDRSWLLLLYCTTLYRSGKLRNLKSFFGCSISMPHAFESSKVLHTSAVLPDLWALKGQWTDVKDLAWAPWAARGERRTKKYYRSNLDILTKYSLHTSSWLFDLEGFCTPAYQHIAWWMPRYHALPHPSDVAAPYHILPCRWIHKFSNANDDFPAVNGNLRYRE